jgi:hypothetical protein
VAITWNLPTVNESTDRSHTSRSQISFAFSVRRNRAFGAARGFLFSSGHSSSKTNARVRNFTSGSVSTVYGFVQGGLVPMSSFLDESADQILIRDEEAERL